VNFVFPLLSKECLAIKRIYDDDDDDDELMMMLIYVLLSD